MCSPFRHANRCQPRMWRKPVVAWTNTTKSLPLSLTIFCLLIVQTFRVRPTGRTFVSFSSALGYHFRLFIFFRLIFMSYHGRSFLSYGSLSLDIYFVSLRTFLLSDSLFRGLRGSLFDCGF